MNTHTQKFEKGQSVSWEWGRGTAYGRIEEVYTEKISRTIKGKKITRNASTEEPAYLIVQENGQEVLKSESEIHNLK